MKKRCPILVKAGVFYKGELIGVEDNWWIKEYCFGGKCPLKECVYDYPFAIKKEDQELLEGIL